MSEENTYTLTIRLIRSFEHRNIKNLVIRNVSKDVKLDEFKNLISQELKSSGLPPPFKNFTYDTLKVEHVPFRSKSNDPVINCLDDDLLILKDENKSLSEMHIVNETEISYFLLKDYLAYKQTKNITE